jgi:hypothetical protein
MVALLLLALQQCHPTSSAAAIAVGKAINNHATVTADPPADGTAASTLNLLMRRQPYSVLESHHSRRMWRMLRQQSTSKVSAASSGFLACAVISFCLLLYALQHY